jgi:pyruvate ferredoxin oxidoreductase gamma subunit
MFQIHIHDRDGQGAVSATEIFSVATFNENMHAQNFLGFG